MTKDTTQATADAAAETAIKKEKEMFSSGFKSGAKRVGIEALKIGVGVGVGYLVATKMRARRNGNVMGMHLVGGGNNPEGINGTDTGTVAHASQARSNTGSRTAAGGSQA